MQGLNQITLTHEFQYPYEHQLVTYSKRKVNKVTMAVVRIKNK